MSHEKLFKNCQYVLEARASDYGKAAGNFGRVAELWNLYLEANFSNPIRLTDSDVAMMMCLFKLVREFNSRKEDNIIDAINYLADRKSVV